MSLLAKLFGGEGGVSKNDLLNPPPSIQAEGAFAERLLADCVLGDADGWRESMVAVNRLIAYVQVLEARVAELEKQ